jgi:hypothetical protein
MWTYCGLRIREGRGWTDNNGVKHPAQWNHWSDEEKAAKGLVWNEDLQPKAYDNRFYWAPDVPRALEDVIDSDGTGELITTPGLKTNAVNQTKTTAGGLLQMTDWYIVRNAETGDSIPEAVSTYRSAVRQASNTIETAINATVNLNEFMALYETDSDGVSIINNWPINSL